MVPTLRRAWILGGASAALAVASALPVRSQPPVAPVQFGTPIAVKEATTP
jgi:hypothetical protein